ncbi:heavy-metal-associated domain-containing protein [Streptomyces sp. ACA25]|uniref:heavy-metal-associated domain-containing protein n=1 Tax=Streptomyces sp. ACA25 TaxID=3022596 RepID=UPI002307467E|nr:heavy-metal-associated domain-containing protein [Streptomyces sp. ACA25]MDB1087681.1 heavy-metal-associated domain-containing protein [Streptomyces sp. ACA25]
MSSSCCTTDGSCSTNESKTVYQVTGVNSGHCRGVVTKALNELDNVRDVHVDLTTGHLTLTTEGEPDDTRIARTIDDAGYEFNGRVTA